MPGYPIDGAAPTSQWALCFNARYGTFAAILDRIASIIRDEALTGLESAILEENSAIANGIMVDCEVGGMPIGSIIWSVQGLAPTENYVLADGSSLLAVDYPELAAVVDRNWMTPDETTIILPDMRGRVAAGADMDVGTGNPGFPGTYEGAKTHTLTEAELPAHTHTEKMRGITSGAGAHGGPHWAVTSTLPLDSGATGGDQPHNNVQPTHYLWAWIKVR